jgi:hypothetical protein
METVRTKYTIGMEKFLDRVGGDPRVKTEENIYKRQQTRKLHLRRSRKMFMGGAEPRRSAQYERQIPKLNLAEFCNRNSGRIWKNPP